MSFTVTVNPQMAVLPATSVALKVTIVTPLGKVEPLEGPAVRTMDTLPQLSEPVGFRYVTAVLLHEPGAVLRTRFPGQTMEGFCPSFTVMRSEQVLMRPDASVARKMMVCTPLTNEEPLGKPAVIVTVGIGEGGEQLSVAVAIEYVTGVAQVFVTV